MSRNEAVVFASFLKMFTLSEDERAKEFENALCDKGIDHESEVPDHGHLLRAYIQLRFEGYTNKYLEEFISTNSAFIISINTPEAAMFPCRCCNYQTLVDWGEYYICRVCFWEDDGMLDEDKYSSPNRMTLREAKMNFQQYGVMHERFLSSVDPERRRQYRQGD